MATSTTTNRDTVVAAFHSQSEAQKAVHDLKNAGFTDDQIGLAAQDREGSYQEQTEGNKAGAGAATGAAVGLGAGTLWGLGIIAGALPAIGPVIAGGALAAVAASAAGTAAAGGLVGALIGLGIPEEEANYYHGEFAKGRTIVTVKATGANAEKARRILDQSNAYDYDRRESEYARDSKAKQRLDADSKMVARQEVLDIDKHAHEGEARVRKEVHTETAHVDVPLKREELVVERTPLHGREAGAIGSGNEEERITLRQEEAEVKKRTVGKEAVQVGKRTVTENRAVEAELREEEIVVDKETGSRTNRPR